MQSNITTVKNDIKNRLKFVYSLVNLNNFLKIILTYTLIYIIISSKSISRFNLKNNNLSSKDSRLYFYGNTSLSTLNIKKTCNFADYWAKINENVYIKSSSAYFIQSSNVIRVFYVASSNTTFNLTVHVEVFNIKDNTSRVIKTVIKKRLQLYHFGTYKNGLLDIEFFPKHIDLKNIDLNLNIFSYNTSKKVTIPVNKVLATIKKKNLPIICSKCFFNMNQSSEYKDLKWWIYLNRKIGYEKIFFCNNSIALDHFDDLIDKNRKFLDIQKLQCLPNFIRENGSDFFEHYDNFRYNGVFNYYVTDIFNTILTNECYLKYSHKFKYVTVIDNDETIIPRLINKTFRSRDNFNFVTSLSGATNTYTHVKEYVDKLKCDKFQNKENNFVSYIEELAKINYLKNSKEFYFQQGYYLSNRLMNQILNIIESHLNTSQDNNFLIKVNASKNTDLDGWRFQISGKEEIQYARNLCKLNRLYVQPFINENKQILESVSKNFGRYFVLLTNKDNEFKMGKTVFNTNVSIEPIKICVHSECSRRDKIISTQFGHLSHFRKVFKFAKNIKFSVRQLLFDFNYFNCYMKPILDKTLSNFFDTMN